MSTMSNRVRSIWKIFLWGWVGFLLFLVAINFGLFGKLPSLTELENPSMLSSSEIYASDGTLMGKYYLRDRTDVRYGDISPNVINALIATEDERFYKHSGIDAKGTARAIFFLGTKGGASTITQQLAKNMLEQGSKNMVTRIIEKFKEWIISVKLEHNFTKEEIITMYLNTSDFSSNAYGIKVAAETYFNKQPSELNLQESAVLVGMLQAPSFYNPQNNPNNALSKRNEVLYKLHKYKYNCTRLN